MGELKSVKSRLELLTELAKQYITEHTEELNTKDINNETPLESFSRWYPKDSDPIYTKFRSLLTK